MLIAIGILTVTTAFSDAPLPAPSEIVAESPDGTKCVVSSPELRVTSVYSVDAETGQRSRLWAMVGWFRVVNVTNDGDHVVIGYDGMNLLPMDYRVDEPMLYFVNRGQLTNVVTLDELIEDLSQMQKTVSHYAWGNYIGFDGNGMFVVDTCEGDRVFDPESGKLLK